MSEKKQIEKMKTSSNLQKSITEIVSATEHTTKLFINVFHVSSENIAGSALGTLMGIFTINGKGDDMAYIVNFLASVAKKEYFSNPRRGAIESFEASLHKINVALAELVKRGNVAWLGKLHGVLGIIEKNNIHFSITGQASILLLRNKQLSDIGQGLSSEEASTHPLKTFVEVSSGRLIATDKIILTSPEVFSVLPPEVLEKNAIRMSNDHFIRFLHTALTNELAMAGIITIDINEPKMPVAVPPRPHHNRVKNVFSKQAFAEDNRVPKALTTSQTHETSSSPTSDDYIDTQTGHIYIQGDTQIPTKTHPLIEHFSLRYQNYRQWLQEFLRSYKKILRKSKKSSLIFLKSVKKQGIIRIQKIIHQRSSSLAQSTTTRKNTAISPSLPKEQDMPIPTQLDNLTTHAITHTFIKEKLVTFYQKNGPKQNVPTDKQTQSVFIKNFPLTKVWNSMRIDTQLFTTKLLAFSRHWIHQIKYDMHSFYSAWKTLDPKKRYQILIGLSILILVLIVIGWILANSDKSATVSSDNDISQTPIESTPADLVSDTHSQPLELITIDTHTQIVAVTRLNDTTYIITNNDIIRMPDEKHFPFPADKGIPIMVTPMPDLDLLFFYTDTQTLLSWSPNNNTFANNTLPLPIDTEVQSIATYLTYLYVLDSKTDQIYRFPRNEGGFSAPTAWLKEAISITETSKMATDEALFLAFDQSIHSFSRGRTQTTLVISAPITITQLYIAPKLMHIYALDTNNIVRAWNLDGTFFTQYPVRTTDTIQSFVVDENTNTIFLATNHALLMLKIPE
ncbi:MAG: hypothetical protein ACSLEX_03950 [Minisyncoccota bacterium]